jgi:hypothetical protein
MHSIEQVKTKTEAFKKYLKMKEGMILTRHDIDQCVQFIQELEAETRTIKK